MENVDTFMEKLRCYGIGRRKIDDDIFDFMNVKKPSRLGVYNMDDENLCHEIVIIRCNIPGCDYSAESLLEFEDHYNSSHRYSCAQCKKILPSPHFLDLHLQENHDSFFAVIAEKRPSYSCYIEECKDKFKTAEERYDHSIKVHKIPKDFRFEHKAKSKKKPTENNKPHMEVDTEKDLKRKVIFSNNKQKTFSKYTGRKFTMSNENKPKNDTEMAITVTELKESLPN